MIANPFAVKNLIDSIMNPQGNIGVGTPPFVPSNSTLPNQGVIDQGSMGNVDRIAQLYNKDYQMLDQFNQALGQMPNRDDFKPGFGRRLGSVLETIGTGQPMGMWGGVPVGWMPNPKAGKAYRDEPYNEALNDWGIRTGMLKDAATLEGANARTDASIENQRIDNERQRDQLNATIANQTANQELRLLIAQMQLEGKEELARMADTRAKEIEAMKQEGRLTALEAQAETQKEIARLRGEITSAQITQRGDITSRQIDERAAAQTEADKAKGWKPAEQTFNPDGTPGKVIQENTVTGEIRVISMPDGGVLRTTPPGTSTSANKPLTPGQKTQEDIRKIIAAVNADPALDKYFDKHPTTKQYTGRLIPPDFNWFTLNNTNKAEYEKARAVLADSPIVPGRTGNPTPQGVVTQPNANQGNRIKVRRLSDGAPGTILESDFDPARYEKVQ